MTLADLMGGGALYNKLLYLTTGSYEYSLHLEYSICLIRFDALSIRLLASTMLHSGITMYITTSRILSSYLYLINFSDHMCQQILKMRGLFFRRQWFSM